MKIERGERVFPQRTRQLATEVKDVPGQVRVQSKLTKVAKAAPLINEWAIICPFIF